MYNLSRTRLRIAVAVIAAFIAQTAAASEHIILNVAPNDDLGGGFGELSPDFHDLRVTVNASGEIDTIDGWDLSGMTVWQTESWSGSSATLVSYFAQEDDMGAVSIEGWIRDPIDPAVMDPFYIGIANVLWPCADCDVDEFGMPLCAAPNALMTCDTSTEGEAEVYVPGDATVAVSIHHTAPGTLTILGATSDLEVLNPDETPFTSAYVSGSGYNSVPLLLRAGPTFSGEVTLVARFLQENAQLDTQDLLIVKAVLPTVEITDAPGTTVLIGDQTTIVGKHISLNTKVTPAGALVTTHRWMIDGKKVKDYTQSMSEGKITEFNEDPNDDFSHVTDPYVDFYWIEGSDDPMTGGTEKFTVTYTATIGGNAYSDSVEFEVQCPTSGLASGTTTANPAVGLRPAANPNRLQFGDSATLNKGIGWTGVVTPQVNGEIAFVQLCNTVRRDTLDNGDKKKITSSGNYMLDAGENVVQYEKATATANEPNFLISDDSPYSSLVGRQKVGADDTFHLYLMFKPEGNDSIWVTLRRLDWYWKGAATETNGAWSMDENSTASSADDDPAPSGTLTTELPEWDGRLQDIEEVDDND